MDNQTRYHVNEVVLDYGPRQRISEIIPEITSEIKMYEQDSAFLCGLLKERKPTKILEVGVWKGGSSAVVMQCMKDLGISFSFYSVDILSRSESVKGGHVGHLGLEAADKLGIDDYHLIDGEWLPSVIESKIGGDVDFLILDTVHKLPGEILDFMASFPFLAKDAVVCLHDIRQNHKNPPDTQRVATNALFNCVVAEKYLNHDPTRTPDYPNFGAFKINQDTSKYITNVIGALTLSWDYSPGKEALAAYRDLVSRYYSEEALWLFDKAVSMNLGSLEIPRIATGVKMLAGRLNSAMREIPRLFRK